MRVAGLVCSVGVVVWAPAVVQGLYSPVGISHQVSLVILVCLLSAVYVITVDHKYVYVCLMVAIVFYRYL